MIRRLGNVFVLDTPNTTYAFGVIPSGQLEHLYYGEKIAIDTEEEAAVLAEKRLSLPGNSVAYSPEYPTIEDNVTIYSGASILGGETVIGEGSIIGGNVFLTSSVKPGSRVNMQNQEDFI